MKKKYTSLEHAIRKVHQNPQYRKLNEDFEHEMARNELRTAIAAAKRLLAQLEGEGDIEAWVQSKITKASDYLDSVADYMSSRDSSVNEAIGGGVTYTKPKNVPPAFFRSVHVEPKAGDSHPSVSGASRTGRNYQKMSSSETLRGNLRAEECKAIMNHINYVMEELLTERGKVKTKPKGLEPDVKPKPAEPAPAPKPDEPRPAGPEEPAPFQPKPAEPKPAEPKPSTPSPAPAEPVVIPNIPKPKTVPSQPVKPVEIPGYQPLPKTKPQQVPKEVPTEPKPEVQPGPGPSPRTKPETKPETKTEPETKVEPETKTEPQTKTEPETKVETKPETKTDPKTGVKPKLPIPFFGGGSDPSDPYYIALGHKNPISLSRAKARIQHEETDRKAIHATARSDDDKYRQNVGRFGKSQLTRQSEIKQKIIDEAQARQKKLVLTVKDTINQKKAGANPLVDTEPRLKHERLDEQRPMSEDAGTKAALGYIGAETAAPKVTGAAIDAATPNAVKSWMNKNLTKKPSPMPTDQEIVKGLEGAKKRVDQISSEKTATVAKNKEMEQKFQRGEISSADLERHYKSSPSPVTLSQAEKTGKIIKNTTPEAMVARTRGAEDIAMLAPSAPVQLGIAGMKAGMGDTAGAVEHGIFAATGPIARGTRAVGGKIGSMFGKTGEKVGAATGDAVGTVGALAASTTPERYAKDSNEAPSTPPKVQEPPKPEPAPKPMPSISDSPVAQAAEPNKKKDDSVLGSTYSNPYIKR